MGKRSSSSSITIMNAKVYENLRKNNINQDTSFNSIRESIKKTLSKPKSALFYARFVVDNQEEYECKVNQIKKLFSIQIMIIGVITCYCDVLII